MGVGINAKRITHIALSDRLTSFKVISNFCTLYAVFKMKIGVFNFCSFLLLSDFRNQMLKAVSGFSKAGKNGLFINSCFAHCQTERQDTWFAQDSPHIGNKVCPVALISLFN